MKRAEFMAIKELLLAKGTLRSDRQAHLFEYVSNRGVWHRIGRHQALRAIITHVRELRAEITVAEAEVVYREISDSPDFWEEKLDSDGTNEYVVCNNGRLNLTTGELGNFDKTAYDRIDLDFNYRETPKIAPDSAWGKFLRTSVGIENFDPRQSTTFHRILQVIGYALSNLFGAKKAFFLLGPPNSGKSVFLNFLGNIIGREHWRPLSLHDLTDKYRAGGLDSIRLLLNHEFKMSSLHKLDVIKSVISGDPIMIEAKGIQPWLCIPRVIPFMAANSLPTLAEVDAGGAFAERLSIFTFIQHNGDRDPKLLDKLLLERDNILSMAFREMAAFINNNYQFDGDEESSRLLAEFRNNSNPLSAFLDENYEKALGKMVSTLQLYTEYQKYCAMNLLPNCSVKQFRPQLAQMGFKFARKRIDGYGNPISCVLNIRKRLNLDIHQNLDGSIELSPAFEELNNDSHLK